jgi:glycerol-3-phosphate O-acyltransferase
VNRTLMWALRGVMRVFVRATVVPEDSLQRLHGRARPLLYVLEERSTSDLLALEIACMKGGLRRPGKRLKLRDLDLPHSAAALERRAGVLRRRADRRTPRELTRAIAATGADPALELDVVPVAVYWGRAPQREKSWLRLIFSENWALVGPFRRLLSIVINGRNTLIRLGEPRSLQSYPGARRLLKDMRAEFRHMRTDTLGPDLSSRRAIVAQVLRTRAVRQAVRQEIRDTRRSRRDGLRMARRHALETGQRLPSPGGRKLPFDSR